MADPLSTATRATKRNLLVASVLAISANAFNVQVEKIPMGGLSINFDSRLFAFLLLVVLLYFFCTFIVYYIIDIKNLERTAHQEAAEKRYNERVQGFRVTHLGRAIQDLAKIIGADYRVIGTSSYSFDPSRNERGYRLLSPPTTPKGNWNETTIFTHPEEYKKLDPHFAKWQSKYPKASTWNRRRARIAFNIVKLTYFTRNYILDGTLPIALGCVAILATFGIIDLAWIQKWLPHTKTIS
jgi:hypothetical protein